MTEITTNQPAAETPPAAPETTAEPEQHPSGLDAVAEKLDKLWEMVQQLLTGSGGAKAVQGEDREMAVEVRAELAKLKAAEDRKKTAAERQAEMDELKAQVKKLTEKQPKEYRRITLALWGGDDD